MDPVFENQLKQILELRSKRLIRNELYVCIGPADPETAFQIRASVAQEYPLLYLYCSEVSLDRFRTMPAGLLTRHIDQKLMEAITLCVTCLKIEKANFACLNNAELTDSTLPMRLNNSLKTLVGGMYHERISRLHNLRCSLRNLPLIQNSLCKVKGKGTALICGAGPSLHTQLDLIKTMRDRIYLITAGKLAPRLCREGIYPDCVVYADYSAYGLDWKEVFSRGALLVAYSTSAPELCAEAEKVLFSTGPGVFFNRAMKDWNATLPVLKFGGTATVSAIDFAVTAGFENIALAGNDLCLGEDGKSHIDHYDNEERFQHEYIKRSGIYGPVVTSPEFERLRMDIENIVAGVKTRIINCSARGVPIAGTSEETLESFLRRCAVSMPEVEVTAGKKFDFKWNTNFSLCAVEHAENLFNESIIKESSKKDFFRYRKTWTELFSEKLIGEFQNDLQAAKNGKRYSGEMHFESFRSFASEFVKNSNPELSAWIKDAEGLPEHFEVYSCFSEYAYISIEENGHRIPLSGSYLNMDSEAEQEINDFCIRHSFDPARQAVVFLEPGSWRHPLALCKKYPESRVIALIAYPEIFAELTRLSMFFHKLPENIVIIAAGPQFKNWKRYYHSALRELRQEGLETLLFENPYGKELNAIKTLKEIILSQL